MKSQIAAAALILSLLAPPGMAAEVELALSSWLPPRHPIVVNAIRPWAEEVEAATGGRVRVRVLGKPLGSPPAHFDIARDGVADIAYGLHSFSQDDRFAGSQVGQFSFIGDDAAAASEAFWTVYTEDLDAQAEHAGVKLLGLFVHGPGLIHNNVRRIETPGDFAGLRIRVPGGYVAELTGALGADALFMSSPEVYERLSRGVIDGVAFTYEALTAFNLTDHVRHSMTVPGGVYNTTWFLVANPTKWAEIAPQDQAAIEALSGRAFAARVGAAWNDADAAAIAAIGAAGIEVHPASDAVTAAIREKGAALERAWAASLPEGRDGAAALARLRGLAGASN